MEPIYDDLDLMDLCPGEVTDFVRNMLDLAIEQQQLSVNVSCHGHSDIKIKMPDGVVWQLTAKQL